MCVCVCACTQHFILLTMDNPEERRSQSFTSYCQPCIVDNTYNLSSWEPAPWRLWVDVQIGKGTVTNCKENESLKYEPNGPGWRILFCDYQEQLRGWSADLVFSVRHGHGVGHGPLLCSGAAGPHKRDWMEVRLIWDSRLTAASNDLHTHDIKHVCPHKHKHTRTKK